jgi:heme/copper-type cytochrome/quinol oxidase subunit 2
MVQHKKKRKLAVFILLLLIILVSSSVAIYILRYHKSSLKLSLTGSSDTGLTITRNGENVPKVSNFTITATNASALTLLHDVDSFQPLPNPKPSTSLTDNSYGCGTNADGVEYTFKFTYPNLTVFNQSNGCLYDTTINNHYYAITEEFWYDVQNAIHQPIDPNIDPNLETNPQYNK